MPLLGNLTTGTQPTASAERTGSKVEATRNRSAAEVVLETVAGERCPCGHLSDRHRKPEGQIPGEKWGACRDCECRGLIDCWSDKEDDV